MSWISRVFGDFDILEGTTRFEEMEGESLSTGEVSANVGHDFDRVVYKDGNETVVVDETGEETQRDTDAAVALHNALDATTFSKIRIRAGTYTFQSAPATGGSCVRTTSHTIEGVDREQVTIAVADGVNPNGVIELRSNSDLRSVTVDANGQNNTYSTGIVNANGQNNVQVKDVRFQNEDGRSSVQFDGGPTDVKVHGCWTEEGGFSIKGSTAEGATISENTVRGVSGNGGLIVLSGGAHGTVSDNVVYGSGGAQSSGISVSNGWTDATITGNTVKDDEGTTSWGIVASIDATQITITGNTVADCQQCIVVDTVSSDSTPTKSDVSVTGNTVRGASTSGVHVNKTPHTSVTGNTALNCAVGIRTVGGSDTRPVTIAGNTVRGSSTRGITASSGVVVSGNTVTNCGTGSDNDGGIRVATGVENTITGNLVEECDPDGIVIDGGDNNTVVGNTAVGNVTNNFNDAGTNTTAGNNNTA